MLRRSAAIILLSAGICFANTYWVAPSGKATNDGSENAPWPDVNTALLKAGGGHLILVKPGVYPAFTASVEGQPISPGKWTNIRSIEKWRAVIATTGTNSIIVRGRYTCIDGFNVCGAASNGIKIEADSVTIRSCWVHNTTTGVYAPNHHEISIDMCYFDQCNDGIYASGTRIFLTANICWNNRRYGINLSPSVSDSSVYNNILGVNRESGIRIAGGAGSRIIQNTVYQCPTGIRMEALAQAIVGNNVIAECGQTIIKPTKMGSFFIRNVFDRYENMAGVAVMNPNPLFVHPGDLPLALRQSSPAIGSGDPNLAPYADFMGQRINPKRVDCGAVQYHPRLEGACPCP